MRWVVFVEKISAKIRMLSCVNQRKQEIDPEMTIDVQGDYYLPQYESELIEEEE